jgi:hypothetical protein
MNDREQTLGAVERVRANAVERARGDLAHSLLGWEQAERVLRECQVAHASAAQRLATELRSQLALFLPQELVWAERHGRALRLDMESARLRFLRAQAKFQQAAAQVGEARAALRELELERRVVSNALERGRNDAALVRSRRQEEENDDAFRSRRGDRER